MGKVTVSANGKSVVHKDSGGKAMATIPDVCITPFPSPPGPLPLPYPNIAESKDLSMGSVMTKIDGQSVALMGSTISQSTGDEVGAKGGIVSGCTKGEAMFIKWSPNVQIEGRAVVRKSDMMIMNKLNTISLSGMDQEDVPDPNAPSIEEETDDIEIDLLDEEGNPYADEQYVIKMRDGSEISGQLDENGYAKIENVPKSYYTVKFPNLDAEQKISQQKKET